MSLRTDKDPSSDLSRIGGLGFTLVGTVLAFTGIGYVLDRWLGTLPWLMVAGVFVGAASGFAYMVLTLMAADRAKRDKSEEGSASRKR